MKIEYISSQLESVTQWTHDSLDGISLRHDIERRISGIHELLSRYLTVNRMSRLTLVMVAADLVSACQLIQNGLNERRHTDAFSESM